MVSVSSPSTPLLEQVQASRRAARQLVTLSPEIRGQALEQIALGLESHAAAILEANQQDRHRAAAWVEQGHLSAAAYARLKLDEAKLATMISSVRGVQSLPDLVGQAQWIRELDEGLILERRTCPLGVLGVIFESRPDALTQIASLALKTGNSVLMKGGSEALYSCQQLTQVIHTALSHIPGFPVAAVQLLTTREEIRELLALENAIDLIIPRGSKSFVQFIQANTSIPVLGHADGICHLYVDQQADLRMAVDLTIDAKVSYPSACNAIETLLVHEQIAPQFLPQVAQTLQEQGVELRGCERSRQWAEMVPATETDWATEYGDLVLSIRVVEDLETAIRHVQTFGSHHTEAIVTADPRAAETFLTQVGAAGVFHNASTRFADGYRYGFGAEVGISTQTLPPRGPVGIEGLVTYQYQLRGQGHRVSDYTGPGARSFTHRDLS